MDNGSAEKTCKNCALFTQHERKAKANKVKKNEDLNEWTCTCPDCGTKHTRLLPSGGDYGGFDVECDCVDDELTEKKIIRAREVYGNSGESPPTKENGQ